MELSALRNHPKKKTSRKRKGRGPGSQGKTSGRGHNGAKSRSGYKQRGAKEGGQLPLFQKLPIRGFSNYQFAKKIFTIGLDRIDQYFTDGEKVNLETLAQKGFPVRRMKDGIKVLGSGELSKKVIIEAAAFTKGAVTKLEKAGIEFTKI